MESPQNEMPSPDEVKRKLRENQPQQEPAPEDGIETEIVKTLTPASKPVDWSDIKSQQGMSSLIAREAVGRSGCIFLAILFLATGIFAYQFRNKGWLPFTFDSSATLSPTKSDNLASEFGRNYVLVSAQPSKLYFYDQQNESISEVVFDPVAGPGNPTPRGKPDLIPSVDKIVPSPNGQKVAIIANRDSYRSGIYVLNLSQSDASDKSKPDDFITQWTRNLEPGYSLRSHSIATWSPDGASLAFVASKEKQPDLFIAESENAPQRVTYQGKNIGTVFWVDNQHLAFVSDWEG